MCFVFLLEDLEDSGANGPEPSRAVDDLSPLIEQLPLLTNMLKEALASQTTSSFCAEPSNPDLAVAGGMCGPMGYGASNVPAQGTHGAMNINICPTLPPCMAVHPTTMSPTMVTMVPSFMDIPRPSATCEVPISMMHTVPAAASSRPSEVESFTSHSSAEMSPPPTSSVLGATPKSSARPPAASDSATTVTEWHGGQPSRAEMKRIAEAMGMSRRELELQMGGFTKRQRGGL